MQQRLRLVVGFLMVLAITASRQYQAKNCMWSKNPAPHDSIISCALCPASTSCHRAFSRHLRWPYFSR